MKRAGEEGAPAGAHERSAFERRFGIRLQATRSRVPKQWWYRRWQDYMESLHMGVRIGRGRQYATGGNVRSLEIVPGGAVARVNGSGPEPYLCKITCEAARGGVREKLVAGIRENPMLLARILAGDLPEEIETRFRAAGLPLTPSHLAPLKAHCSCPDGAVFCKHSAAVLFLMGEAFGFEPLLLLEMRGITAKRLFGLDPDELSAALLEGRGEDSPDAMPPPAPNAGKATPPRPAFEESLMEFPGPLPFWRGESRFGDTVREMSDHAAAAASRILNGEIPRRRI